MLVGWTSWLLLHQAGSDDEARHLAISQAEAIEPSIGKASPTHVSVWGNLLVWGAVAAAREDDPEQADDILNLAELAAVRLDALPEHTKPPYESNFGARW
jgi:hypothetical protein